MKRIENVTLVDGQRYQPGDEIWDLGSFVATSAKGRKRNYEGLSKDVDKLPHYVDTGSSAFCLDTGDFYKYLRSTDIWYKMGNNQASGGSSGVSDYNDLNGKPQINGVTLQGNMTLEDLGITNIMNKSAGTPVGEIISFMGNTAPENYLACDGTEYNITDYPDLANFFAEQFGAINHFGGDGITTFAVPDLRGEFLRGTGENSHENQGNGANVGNHQSATIHPFVGTTTTGAKFVSGYENNKNFPVVYYYDYNYTSSKDNSVNQVDVTTSTSRNSTLDVTTKYTSRPTNTSVMWCIKAVRTFSMKSEDAKIYSYDECVVGRWIDGKVLYQKTVSFDNLVDNSINNISTNISNIEAVISMTGSVLNDTAWLTIPYYLNNNAEASITIFYNKEMNTINILPKNRPNLTTGFVTIQYTKTTD